MTDEEATKLLELLEKYVAEYPTEREMQIGDLVEDLAMSMDVTNDHADTLRRSIESNLG